MHAFFSLFPFSSPFRSFCDILPCLNLIHCLTSLMCPLPHNSPSLSVSLSLCLPPLPLTHSLNKFLFISPCSSTIRSLPTSSLEVVVLNFAKRFFFLHRDHNKSVHQRTASLLDINLIGMCTERGSLCLNGHNLFQMCRL